MGGTIFQKEGVKVKAGITRLATKTKRGKVKKKLEGENRKSESQKIRYQKIGNKKSKRKLKGESRKSESQQKRYKKIENKKSKRKLKK
jgi:hypothetical protein